MLLFERSPRYLRYWSGRLSSGLHKHQRDCMDMAGKLPICLKALDIGLGEQDLIVDAAQAGGLLGKR